MSDTKLSPIRRKSFKKSTVRKKISLLDLLYHHVMGSKTELSPDQVARELNQNKKTVQKYLSKLSKDRLLHRVQKGREVYYSNPKISNSKSSILSSLEVDNKKSGELLKRIHKLRFRALIREESVHFRWRLQQAPWVENPLRNWSEYHSEIILDDYEAFIRVTTKHVIVELPELEVMDLDEGIQECYRRAEQVFRWFGKKYNLRLGEIQCRFVQTQMHVALVNHPLASFMRSKGWFYFGKRIAVDSSKERDELEAIDVRHAEEDGNVLAKDYEVMLEKGITFSDIYDNQARFLCFLENQNKINLNIAALFFNNGAANSPKQAKGQTNKPDWRFC